jgi:hypothetical protein
MTIALSPRFQKAIDAWHPPKRFKAKPVDSKPEQRFEGGDRARRTFSEHLTLITAASPIKAETVTTLRAEAEAANRKAREKLLAVTATGSRRARNLGDDRPFANAEAGRPHGNLGSHPHSFQSNSKLRPYAGAERALTPFATPLSKPKS